MRAAYVGYTPRMMRFRQSTGSLATCQANQRRVGVVYYIQTHVAVICQDHD